MTTGILILIAILAVLGAGFWAYHRGRDSARLDDAEANLNAAKRAREIENETSQMSDTELDNDLLQRMRKDGR